MQKKIKKYNDKVKKYKNIKNIIMNILFFSLYIILLWFAWWFFVILMKKNSQVVNLLNVSDISKIVFLILFFLSIFSWIFVYKISNESSQKIFVKSYREIHY